MISLFYLFLDRDFVARMALAAFLFASEFLRALGVAPDVGRFKLQPDFDQAFLFGIEVKDTSAFPWRARQGRRERWLGR